ncbi:hypothetical protein [Streptomyces hokutonensis]|uniref:hypothetical protein n=1 Tax=Streptomyces hokutonensis TaxID=1306990 RepID=UPI0033F33779
MTSIQRVFVNEGVFGLLDGGVIASESADWSNGLVAPMTQGALISTGINTGLVQVTIQSRNDEPKETPADSWEEIVEVSVHAPTGQLRVESLELGPADDDSTLISPAEPACYRARVHARGREILRDRVSMEPVEDYLLVVWPAPQGDTTILCTSNRIQQSLDAPHVSPAKLPEISGELNPSIRKPIDPKL